MRPRPRRHVTSPRFLAHARWTALVCLWAAAVLLKGLAAQDAPAAATISTRSGVYSAAQAEKGQALYEASCLGGCHSASSHKGIAFEKRWTGHPVGELVAFINERMPDDDPGSVTWDQSLQIVAYMLKLNGLPAGTSDLPQDDAALQKIKIELPVKQPGGTDTSRPAR